MQRPSEHFYFAIFLFCCHIIPVQVEAKSGNGDTNTTLQVPQYLHEQERSDRIAMAISPCRYEDDPVYANGTLVDCRDLGLTNIIQNWFPLSTTTIRMGGNSLTRLENFSFSSNHNLRRLDLSENDISVISPQAFEGLGKLEILDLEHNNVNLDEKAPNPLILNHLPNLRHVGLAFNGNSDRLGNYSENLLLDMKKLMTLTLDTFYGILNFNNLFRDMVNLTSLVLTGGMYNISNDAFVSLKDMPITELKFHGTKLNDGTDTSALQYFKHLETLSITESCQTIENTFHSLFPFQGRTMTSLIFDKIAQFEEPWSITPTVYIDNYTTQYLRNICVENFSLTNSRVFYLTFNAFASRLWYRCLKSLDLRGNPLLANGFHMFYFIPMIRLASLKVHNCKYNNINGKPPPQTRSLDSLLTKRINNLREGKPRFLVNTPRYVESHSYVTETLSDRRKTNLTLELNMSTTNLFQGARETGITLWSALPPNLEFFQFSGCMHSFHLSNDIVFRNAGKVKYLDLSDSGGKKLYGNIRGFTNVSHVDLSYNDGQHMPVSFFDTFPTVRHLRLVGMNLNNSLALVNGKIFFENLTHLEIIDLSDNGLSSLESGAFDNCPHLVSINLSRNKFRSVPISQRLPPELQELDMTHNSIVSISEREQNFVDDHAKRVSNFSMQLAGNFMSCGCPDLKFIYWLKLTKVNLDEGRDYPCLDESGNLLRTKIKMDNVEALWRSCWGPRALAVSVILFTLMILCYILCFFFIHFHTFIMTGLIGLFTRNFIFKTPADYRYGVFIGYSDADYRFACFSLRLFLEDKLRLSTYVRHRDLLPAMDMAESIMESMNSSWRVLLLVTDAFLQQEHWAFFTLKAAVYCVDPLNPRRVVLVVGKGCLQRIPRSLLRVVPEDSIIQVEKPLDLDPDKKQFLCNAIKV